jgi:steroid 5-alpha reductase family enzyme
MTKNKAPSLLLILLVYVIAFGIGGAALRFLSPSAGIIIRLFIATSIATVIVFCFNLIFNNASVYDPYWSVQPLFIITCFYFISGISLEKIHLLLLIPLGLWTIRLTVNWAIGFDNLNWQDWRYRDLKNQYPKYDKILVFFGIMYMPTVLVFLGTIPLIKILSISPGSFVFEGLGGIIILAGTILELIADTQMKQYKKDPGRSAYINRGIWKYSRHPNYLGEILIWLGILIGSLYDFSWVNPIGALLIILLFTFISIPMMEKHMIAKAETYREYQAKVWALIPLGRKKEK